MTLSNAKSQLRNPLVWIGTSNAPFLNHSSLAKSSAANVTHETTTSLPLTVSSILSYVSTLTLSYLDKISINPLSCPSYKYNLNVKFLFLTTLSKTNTVARQILPYPIKPIVE